MERGRIKKKIRIAIACFIVLMIGNVVFFHSVGRLLDTSLVRTFISESVYRYTDLRVEYESVETIIFPLPGFSLQGVSIRQDEETVADVRRLDLIWNIYALFAGDFELKSIDLSESEFRLLRDKNGNLSLLRSIDTEKIDKDTEEFREEQLQNPMSPDQLMELIPVRLKISKLKVVYVDEILDREDILVIDVLDLSVSPAFRKVHLDLDAKLNDIPIELDGKISLVENSWDFENLRMEARFQTKDMELDPYRDFLAIFPKGSFKDAKLQLEIAVKKSNESLIHIHAKELSLENLRKKRAKNFPPIHLGMEVDYDLATGDINIYSLEYKMKDRSEVSFSAVWKEKNTEKDKSIAIESNLKAESFHLESTMGVADIFSKPDFRKFPYKSVDASGSESKNYNKVQAEPNAKKQSIQINALSNLDLNKLNLNGTMIQSVQGKIQYKDDTVFIKDISVGMYQGSITANGTYMPGKKGNNLNLTADINRVQLEYLLESLTGKKLVTGALNSHIYMNTRLGTGDDFVNNLKLESRFHVNRGELLGYANFIKPVAEVGKFINFSAKNEGKSTEFKKIQGDVKIQNGKLTLSDFKMDGVGVDAKGSGTYSLLNDRMDMKFTASLSGNAGKAIKIPIIYKGILGKNVAYLDPVWLASVYAGTIFLAGPAGALVGGVAGSLASDTVDSTASSVKSGFKSAKNFLFGGGDKEEDD